MNTAALLAEILDGNGRTVRLGRKIGEGGEGAVFEVETDPETVAKIYHQPLPSVRADKIRAMAAVRNEQIEKLTAWPIELLTLRSGAPVGIKMPKVVGHKDIHQLYSPKSRRVEFRRADWRFLVRAAANLSRAFATVHAASCLVADVNHGGIMVAQDARVRLIDCDSFQIEYGGRKYLCTVGVPTFTPPELQGVTFAEKERTENHDNFGLAVMIFLVLFMGRHPFAGRYLGPGEMPIEQAIRELRFVYGVGRAAVYMEQPPGTPALEIVSPSVAALFERAFARESMLVGRPTAREWLTALETLEGELVQCEAAPTHWHFSGLQRCPWCRMEGATGVALFSPAVSPGAASFFDLDSLWKQVEAVEPPGAVPMLEEGVFGNKIELSRMAGEFLQRRWFHRPLALFLAAASTAVGIYVDLPLLAKLFFFVAAFVVYATIRKMLRSADDIEIFIHRERLCREQWDKVRNEWEAKAGPGLFVAKRKELDGHRAAWLINRQERADRLKALAESKRESQLNRFLDGVEIRAGEVPGIGAGRKSILESFGISTAADVSEEKLAAVPGFGEKLCTGLLDWRRSIEAQFVFDETLDVDIQDREAVEEEMQRERLQIEAAIRRGFVDLQQLHRQSLFARTSMRGGGETAYRAYLQAVADLNAVQH